MTTIKNSLLLFVFFAVAICFTSCEKDIDTDTDNVELPASIEGTYTGVLTYTTSTGQITTSQDGSASLSKSGTTYTISFSDGVPSLTGLVFRSDGGAYATVSSSNSVSGIDVDEVDLSIGATKDGNNWAFSGEK